MTLRVNRRACYPEEYLAMLERAGLPAEQIGPAALLLERPVPVELLPGFVEGLVSVQDLAAQYAAPLLDLCDGLRVLDACAAPGGKTAHLLELAAVRLTAIDRDAKRLAASAGEPRSGLRLVATPGRGGCGRLERWWDGQPFDRILLDAPCTASGVVRRHPDIKWLRRPEDDLPPGGASSAPAGCVMAHARAWW